MGEHIAGQHTKPTGRTGMMRPVRASPRRPAAPRGHARVERRPSAIDPCAVGGVAVKVDAGYTFLPNVWDGVHATPDGKLARLGDLVHLSFEMELLGREDVELDDGESATATVLTGHGFDDYVIDPATGNVVWRATCWIEGDGEFRPTTVTRDGATFVYGACKGDPTPVRFTAAQATSCPS